jgi:hypothetical protein
MPRILLLLAFAVATALSTSLANATIRITADRGGPIVNYMDRFLQARASGEQVVIDGACLSACTLAIGMLPPGQVCATSRAVLGFHAAWHQTENGGTAASPAATQSMMDIYPAPLRNWINRHGGLTPKVIFLRGRELAGMVSTCGSVARVPSAVIRTPQVLRLDTARAQRVR